MSQYPDAANAARVWAAAEVLAPIGAEPRIHELRAAARMLQAADDVADALGYHTFYYHIESDETLPLFKRPGEDV
jgi:hypothetical protein